MDHEILQAGLARGDGDTNTRIDQRDMSKLRCRDHQRTSFQRLCPSDGIGSAARIGQSVGTVSQGEEFSQDLEEHIFFSGRNEKNVTHWWKKIYKEFQKSDK